MEAKSELTKIPGIGMNMAELEGLMMMVTLRTFEDDDIGISIKQIIENKRDYLPLLLLGDEVESGIMQYLDRCGLFAVYDDDLR
jgi:hypothetical protein